jgi:hypothetical protein
MQSFGNIVVRTRRGERTVDLLCISSPRAITFLVEAKTSNRPYTLPASDERALRDYVAGVGRVHTIPKLRLVLIVSGAASQTLCDKLRKLERDVAVPVRFISAVLLAKLRDQLPGVETFSDIAEAFVDAPHVVPGDVLDELSALWKRQRDAHEELVRSMMRLPSGHERATRKSKRADLPRNGS